MTPENPSTPPDPLSSSAAPLLPRLFGPREFAAAFQTLKRGFVSGVGRPASTVSSAPDSDFTCFCRNTTELGTIAVAPLNGIARTDVGSELNDRRDVVQLQKKKLVLH